MPGAGETERSFLLLRTVSRGVAIVLVTGSGGVRYQQVAVGLQDLRSSVFDFRLGEIGLLSRVNMISIDKLCSRQRQDKPSFAASNSSSVANTASQSYINTPPKVRHAIVAWQTNAHLMLVCFLAPPPHFCRILFRSRMRLRL